MARTATAIVKPTMLVWARETAGYTVPAAAAKLKIAVDRLVAWESGDETLSVAQLRTLAEVYKRPFAAFYLPEPPASPRVADFRRSSDPEAEPLIRYEVRKAHARRNAALELTQGTDWFPKFDPGPVEASVASDPEKLAAKARDLLGVSVQVQQSWADTREAFNSWRAVLEAVGILVFQTTRIELNNLSGFSISERPLPVIVVNNKHPYSRRCFSLMHEFAHILLRHGGLCTQDEDSEIESFCNRVAGALLVPVQALVDEPEVRQWSQPDDWPNPTVTRLARRYKVSEEVLVRRLVIAGRATKAFYARRRAIWAAHTYDQVQPKEESSGGPRPSIKALSQAGPAFVGLVLARYADEEISSSEVSDLLGLRLKFLPDLESDLAGKQR